MRLLPEDVYHNCCESTCAPFFSITYWLGELFCSINHIVRHLSKLLKCFFHALYNIHMGCARTPTLVNSFNTKPCIFMPFLYLTNPFDSKLLFLLDKTRAANLRKLFYSKLWPTSHTLDWNVSFSIALASGLME